LARIEGQAIVFELKFETVTANTENHRDTGLTIVSGAVSDDIAHDLLEDQLAPVTGSGPKVMAVKNGAKLAESPFEPCARRGERENVTALHLVRLKLGHITRRQGGELLFRRWQSE